MLHNFGFAQYYRADAETQKGNSPYQSRGIVMVRGDYVAVRDEVEDAGGGTFNWANESNGLFWQIYDDTDFQQPIKSFVNDNRFPLELGEDQIRDFGLPKSTFSIRATGQWTISVAGRYKFCTTWNNPRQDVPAADTVRLYLDDQKLFDGKGPGIAEIELEARPYTLRLEYVHAGGAPAYLKPSWLRPDHDPQFHYMQIEAGFFRIAN